MESGGETFIVEGEHIILSSGAIGSPQLLMLSGIGPADQLQQLGIPVILDDPGVGQNLRDHPNIRVPIEVDDDFPLNPKDPRSQVALRYTATGSELRNDVQIMASSFSSPISGDPLEAEGIRFTCILEMAYGSGNLAITSTDPNVQPELNYNYFQDPRDLSRMREAVRKCIAFLDHPDYKNIVKTILDPMPSELVSDEGLDNWLRRSVTTSQHISGTCKMGTESDPMAVVDQHGNVRGVENLTVADASIMPDCIRANTNCTTIMIGERVAEWIKQG